MAQQWVLCVLGRFTSFTGILILMIVIGNAYCTIDIEIEESPSELTVRYQATSTDDQCNDLPDGSYPDYYQACRMFFVCSMGKKAATFWCTKGYVFSLSSGQCEPPDRALCPDPNHMILPLNSDMVAEDCIKGDGVYPDYSDECSTFFICKGGVKTAFRCPESTKFDWKTKSCRSADANKCRKLTCEDKQDGLYIDSTSYCRRYFQCNSGNITENVCPAGTIYNARHRRCTRSSTTRCPGSDAAQCTGIPDGYYPDFAANCKVFGLCMNGGLKTFNCPANTQFDSKSLTCDTDAQCPKPNTNICSGKHNGIHPVLESGCRDFYLCLDGLLTHKGSCPQGKILNPENGNCQPASMVGCLSITDPDCNRLPDGVYPDYDTGCSAYFVCLGSRRISTSYCPNNQLYDVATRKCLPPSFVLCRAQSYISPPRLLDSYNCDNRLGIYPEFSSDCKRYTSCAYGHKKYFNCSESYYFNPESNTCQKEDRKCKAPYAVATFQCLPGDDGVYVDANCSRWHECRNGVGFTNICPKRLQYDIKRGKCVDRNIHCSSESKIKKRAIGGGTNIPTELKNYNFDCISKPDGVYADSQSCAYFHFCIQQHAYSYSCPSNFTFDKELHICAPSSYRNKCSTSRSRSIDLQQYFSCDQLEDGMYSDFGSDCRRYFVCERGNAIPVYCPDGQKFNSVKMFCDKEDRVRCSPSGIYSEDPETQKYSRQYDDSYHVYGPEELYTETYSTFSRNQPSTRNYNIRSRNWDDHDDYSVEDKAPESTDNHEIADNQSVPNSIQNEPARKRQYPLKTYATPSPSYSSRHSPTASSNDEQARNINSTKEKTVKLHQVRVSNRDLDLACRKGDTGFFPDYESGCKLFHICFRTIRKTYSCPSVLLFNPETKNCDLPENVLCNRPEPMLEDTFDCRDKVNQFTPDYSTGCKNYVGCINGLPYRFTCPKGKIFSHVTAICESEESSQCEFSGDYNSTEYIASEEQAERFPIYRHVHGIPGHFYFSCSEKSDGFYPDYTRHCHVFYRCVRGKKFSHYCKQGLLFNPASGICDFEENVVCKSENSTVTSN